MQAGEAVTKPVKHSEDHEKCPFCPQEETKYKSHTDDEKDTYVSYGGEENDSKSLSAIMLKPTKLLNKQPNARPKDGVYPNQESSLRPKDDALYTDPEMGPCSCEAHHLISGKQALMGHIFEQWISAKKGRIESDTGYSVNNAENGLWAPSVPKKYQKKGGPLWTSISEVEQFALAKRSMAATGIQFHKGHHAIPPKDPEQENYVRYNDYIKNELKIMNRRMWGWAKYCPCQDERKENGAKYQPSVRANVALDRLSAHLQTMLCGPAGKWKIFLSAHARDYNTELTTRTEK